MKKAFIFFTTVSLLLSPILPAAASQPVVVAKRQGSHCANENKYCAFKGTYFVYFGAQNRWTKTRRSNGVDCNTKILGDPLPGVAKSCYIKKPLTKAERKELLERRKKQRENKKVPTVNNKARDPSLPPPPSHMAEGGRFCSYENRRCDFKGKYLVYFGAEPKYWRWSIHKDGVICNKETLGDPGGYANITKSCWIKKVTKLIPTARRPKTSVKADTHTQDQPNQDQPNQGYPDQGYPDQGYPNQAYPDQGYPDQGYPNQAYPDQGYPNQGYPAESGSLVEYEEKAAVAKSRGNHRRALRYYRKAAETGDANAQFRLGNLYFEGYGSSDKSRNRPKALAWWESAARQGHPEAQFKVGDYYDRHNDLQTALKWYRQAVDQHDSDAQARLGYMYLTGQGVSENPELGLDYLHQSAEQGNAEGCYLLGVTYMSGRAGHKDLGRAEHWFLKAAEQNHVEAPYQLGIVYEEASNYREAIHWYGRAANLGNKDAMHDIQRLNHQRKYEKDRRNSERHRSSGGGFRN